MKKLKLFLLAALCLIGASANAQNENGTTEGYQGFIELNMGRYVKSNDFRIFNMSTTHGVQINPNVFVGAGIGYDFYAYAYADEHDVKTDVSGSIPVFANFRWNVLDKKISPVFDLKAGYTFGLEAVKTDNKYDIKNYVFTDGPSGFYTSVALGCRFAFGTHAIVPQVRYKWIATKKVEGFNSDNVGFVTFGATYEF